MFAIAQDQDDMGGNLNFCKWGPEYIVNTDKTCKIVEKRYLSRHKSGIIPCICSFYS